MSELDEAKAQIAQLTAELNLARLQLDKLDKQLHDPQDVQNILRKWRDAGEKALNQMNWLIQHLPRRDVSSVAFDARVLSLAEELNRTAKLVSKRIEQAIGADALDADPPQKRIAAHMTVDADERAIPPIGADAREA